ncbi:MAG: PQQ-binding-like beta-propeller repeat protein [Cyclobacteriaceae bacterium]
MRKHKKHVAGDPKIALLVSGFLISLMGCELFSDKDVKANSNVVEPLWSAELYSPEAENAGYTYLFATENLVFENVNKNGKWFLTAFDAESGDQLWDLSDIIDPNSSFCTEPLMSQNEGVFYQGCSFLSALPINLKAVDLDRGEILWETKNDSLINSNSVKEQEHIYFGRYENNSTIIYAKNIKTGMENSLTRTSGILLRNPVDYFGTNPAISVFRREDTDYLYLTYSKISEADSTMTSLMAALYNLTDEEYVYDKVIMELESLDPTRTIIYDNAIAIMKVNSKVIATDVMSAQPMWETDSFRDYFSFFISGDVLLLNSSGFVNNRDYKMSGLDARTGKYMWHEQVRTGTRRVQIRNGIAYYVLRSDSGYNLMALDTKNGKVIMEIEPPNKEALDSFFLYELTSNSKHVFVRTLSHLYCYELIR